MSAFLDRSWNVELGTDILIDRCVCTDALHRQVCPRDAQLSSFDLILLSLLLKGLDLRHQTPVIGYRFAVVLIVTVVYPAGLPSRELGRARNYAREGVPLGMVDHRGVGLWLAGSHGRGGCTNN